MNKVKEATIAGRLLRVKFVSVVLFSYTRPCAIMALATFMKPATLAPFT